MSSPSRPPARTPSSQRRRNPLMPIQDEAPTQETAVDFGESLGSGSTNTIKHDVSQTQDLSGVHSDTENTILRPISTPGRRTTETSAPLFLSDGGADPSSEVVPPTPGMARTGTGALLYPPSSDPFEPSSTPRTDTIMSLADNVGVPSRSAAGTPRHRRGDINGNRVFDRLRSGSETGRQMHLGFMSDIHGASSQVSSSVGLQQHEDPVLVQPVIWGTTVSIGDTIAAFKEFILNFIKPAAAGHMDTDETPEPFYPRLLKQLKEAQQCNLNLDCRNLKRYPSGMKLYHQLVRYPQEVIPLMDHTLSEIFKDMFAADVDEGIQMRVRPFNLERSVNLRELNPGDIDQLVTVKGIVIRSSPVIPDLKQAFFRCHVCDQTLEVDNDRGRIEEPTRCPRDECQSRNSMQLIHNRCIFADKQISRLQETPDETPDGQTPHTVSMCIYDDLVDVCKPGDRVEITGIFRGIPVRVNPRRRGIKPLFKTYVDIVHVKRTNQKRLGIDRSIVSDNEYIVNFEEGDEIARQDPQEQEKIDTLAAREDLYELLARSIAPSIFGMEDVKKGVLLQLFGGTNKFQKDKPGSPRIRGDINVLLVGDPGVSKSQLLQYVHKIAPRGVYTSGKGSSAVGLTAYVTRDPDSKQLVLESGALVLSDGGVCCIDEFDKMSDYTRSVLHEVMEQQTISVAKAGIITTLNARTSILACANPINSKFDEKLSVVENVNLPAPLMSRFDLCYLVLDRVNEEDDRRLAKHLVGFYCDEPFGPSSAGSNENGETVPIEVFTKYINYAKSTCHPTISEGAGEALIDYYVKLRSLGKDGGSRTITFTTRQLESMIRLAEASARMRLSPEVLASDVAEAHRLVMAALQTSAIDPKTGMIDLDLVNTGISARERRGRVEKRDQLRHLITDGEWEQGRKKWAELFREVRDMGIREREFNELLGDLVDEGVCWITGRTNADKVIRK